MVYFKGIIKKHKLILSYLLIILLFFSFGIFTIKGIVTVGDLTKMIYDHPLVVSNASLNAGLNITKMHRSMKDVVLANDSEEIKTALQAVAGNELKVYQQLDVVRAEILGKEGQALEKQTRQLFSAWKPIREEVVRLLQTGDKDAAVLITQTTGAEHVLMLEMKMLELASYARKKADNFLSIAESSQSKLEKITIVLTVAGVLVSVIIAYIATYLVVKTENVLQDEKIKLQKALNEIRTLRGIIPICSYCKQIRDDEGLWKKLEEYIHAHSEAAFSHGICPDCMKTHYPEEYASMRKKKKQHK